MSIVFYDTEATGPNPLHDQMLSVAAVLTDEALQPVDSVNLRCRLRPHQLPAAEALLVTGLSMADITDPSLPSLSAMIRTLDDRLRAWRPDVIAGYSNLEFDELLLAESRACAGLPPHLAVGSRLDVQRLALGLHEFAPGAIAFAPRFDGQPSYRLVDVARANGILPGRAHDAMGDVETTLGVARLMRERAAWWWDHMLRMGRPEEAARFAMSAPVRLYSEFHHNRPHHWLVTGLGPAAAGHAVVGFDLAHDPAEGLHLDGQALLRWLRRHPRPLRLLRTGETPFLLAREMMGGRITLSDPEANRRATLLMEEADYRKRLIAAQSILDPSPEGDDRAEERDLLRGLENPTPDLETRQQLEKTLATRMLADEGAPWMTLNRAFDEADRALDGATDDEASRIGQLIDYLKEELAWAEGKVPPQNRSKANS